MNEQNPPEISTPKMLRPTFNLRADERDQEKPIFKAIDRLMESLSGYQTIHDTQTYLAQEHIQECFEAFLAECGFHKAAADFQTLLGELAGEVRSSNMPPWYHQFGPILLVLSMVRDDRIPLDSLQETGGLESFIRTHIHHDRIEDVEISLQQFGKDLQRVPNDVPKPDKDQQQIEALKSIAVYQSVYLISKKHVQFDDDGQVVRNKKGKAQKVKLFDDNKDYMHNMLHHNHALGEVWILKLSDGCENQGFLDVPKFTVQKRLDKCIELIDMFKSPGGFSDVAIDKWPQYANSIRALDSLMGGLVTLNLREIRIVDGVVPPISDRSIAPFLDHITSLNMPRAFHPFYNWLDSKHEKAMFHDDPKIRARTQDFLENHVYPDLNGHHQAFPNIFIESEVQRPSIQLA